MNYTTARTASARHGGKGKAAKAPLGGEIAVRIPTAVPPLWKWAEDNLPQQTVQIQDYWHVCEHLSHLAQDL